jgi:hypothetical protein
VVFDDAITVPNRQDDAIAASENQLTEQYLQERPACDWSHRFGDAIEPGCQPRAQSAGENNCFHGMILRA